MSDNRFLGTAAAVQQVDTFTPASITSGNTFTLTVTGYDGRTVAITITATDTANTTIATIATAATATTTTANAKLQPSISAAAATTTTTSVPQRTRRWLSDHVPPSVHRSSTRGPAHRCMAAHQTRRRDPVET